MKILYVGSERNDAQAVATALRGIDQAVAVSRVAHLEHAVRWLDEHRDITALVIESPIDAGSGPSVLAPLRSLGWHPAVVLIVPDGTALPVDPQPGAHCYIQRNQSLFRNLPVVVTRAIERAARADLERQLSRATAALHEAERRHKTAVAATDRQLSELQSQYEIGMARAAATWDMVDEQLRTAALEVERANQDRASAAADVDRLSRQLAEADAAVEAANARAEEERVAAGDRLAEQQRTLEAQIAHEAERRRSVEERLEEAVGALDDAEKRHASEMTDATAQSRELEATLRLTREDLESKAADIERLATLEVDLQSRLADIVTSRIDLERRLTATEAAFEDAVTRATRERLEASKKAALREAELDGQLRRESATRLTLEQAVADGEAALRDAQQRHDAALAAAGTELGARQTHFDRALSQIAGDRDRLAQQLADTDCALEQTRQDHRAAIAEIDRLTLREVELAAQLADAQAARDTLEQAVAAGETALRDAQQRHDAALAAAATELGERQAQFDRALSQTAGDRDRLAQQLSGANAALEQARQDQRAATDDIERLTQREAELTSQLADVQATRDALEQAVADGETALRDAHQRHDAALSAAAAERGERQARFDRELTETAADRDRLAQQLSDTGAALEQARKDHRAAAADIERLMQRDAELTSRLADGEAARQETQQQHEAALAAAAAELAQLQAGFDHELSESTRERDRLRHRLDDTSADLADVCRAYEFASADIDCLTRREAELTAELAEAEAALHDAQRSHDAALAAAATEFAEHEARLDRELSRAADERHCLTEQLSDAAATLERVRCDHQSAIASIERLTQQEAELRSELDDVHHARHTLEQFLTEARARAVEREQQFDVLFAQEQLEHESRLADVQESNRALAAERDALRQSLTAIEERSQQLEQSLAARVEAFEASRAESQRLFEQAGLAMFRCTRDGALIDANRACTSLVGRRTLAELQGAQFPAGIFEAPNALFWLLERCLITRVKETVEATWRRHDGGRLFVRVSARLSGSDVIEFVAEDLTRLRILEERLSQAHRMEAVGRLASEVAVTCGTLLGDIHQSGREWLTRSGLADDARRGGERLLDEVRRAAALMQELATCGDEQHARTPMLVDLNTLIRDLEPVLKRVAGSDVDIQLQDISSPLNVDVGTEQVERLLVNLASYGRGRMPSGGQLRIELGTIVVDRRFATKHPNVRLGLHAMITVTEVRRAARTDVPPDPRAQRPGVDFGTLQALVSECGGHLWMKVLPLGEMVAKIRLPLSSPQGQSAPRTLVVRSSRERTATRWFQS